MRMTSAGFLGVYDFGQVCQSFHTLSILKISFFSGYVQSKENPDIYSTTEPMSAYHQRISFCLDIHNSSVKAMRFPPKSYNKDLESADERREREQLELESAKEIADEDFDGF